MCVQSRNLQTFSVLFVIEASLFYVIMRHNLKDAGREDIQRDHLDAQTHPEVNPGGCWWKEIGCTDTVAISLNFKQGMACFLFFFPLELGVGSMTSSSRSTGILMSQCGAHIFYMHGLVIRCSSSSSNYDQ